MTAILARPAPPVAPPVPPAGLLWFARHEARLAFREFIGLMTGGRGRSRLPAALLWVTLALAALHLLAYGVLARVDLADDGNPTTRIVLTGLAFLAWMLMLAQSMESATRVLYGRADLDLILASPSPARGLFAIRIGVTALTTTAMAMVLVAPFANIAVWLGGPRWFAAYGAVAAMGLSAAAVGVAATLGLFALIGPKRTRLIAQVVAAVLGAGFVIGAQAVGILAYGDMSRLAVLRSPALIAAAPGPDSPLWWPARAASGDLAALFVIAAFGLAAFLLVVIHAADRFGSHALAAAGVPVDTRRGAKAVRFAVRGPVATLRAKEIRLLVRDPWLISQTMMQILYLLPPALMLWRSFGSEIDAVVTLVPVLVMAGGQLAGGLAWLTISGEDAPDLIATAPVSRFDAVRAKAEAVVLSVAVPLTPLVLAMAVASPRAAIVTVAGIGAATASATTIQFFFRSVARRSQFRRRQTASRIATFAEAFSSIAWAGTAGLAAAGVGYWGIPAVVAGVVLMIAKLLSPRRGD